MRVPFVNETVAIDVPVPLTPARPPVPTTVNESQLLDVVVLVPAPRSMVETGPCIVRPPVTEPPVGRATVTSWKIRFWYVSGSIAPGMEVAHGSYSEVISD